MRAVFVHVMSVPLFRFGVLFFVGFDYVSLSFGSLSAFRRMWTKAVITKPEMSYF